MIGEKIGLCTELLGLSTQGILNSSVTGLLWKKHVNYINIYQIKF
jgi:hypothetical protein